MKIKKNQKLFIYEIKKRKKDLYFWGTAIFIVLIIFIFICRKDNSVFLTLSSMTQALSFIIIFLKVITFENCSGISANSLICFIEVFIFRIIIALFFSFHLVLRLANSSFYFLSELTSLIFCIYLLYMIYYSYPETSDIMIDSKIPFYYLSILCLILAILFKPYVFQNWFGDLIYIYAIFLECISLYPQIILFSTKKGQIESFTAHYIALQGFSIVFNLLFWIKNFYSINDTESLLLGEFCGYLIALGDIIQLIIMGYYYCLYFRSLFNRKNHKKFDI